MLDCIVITSVDAHFELHHQRGADTTLLTSWSNHFEPLAVGFDAQAYETNRDVPAIDFESGDELVFRYSATGTSSPEAWIPNGDGELAGGRIPYMDLPK